MQAKTQVPPCSLGHLWIFLHIEKQKNEWRQQENCHWQDWNDNCILRYAASPGAVHYSVQAVGDGQDGAVWKLFADGVLNQVVCLQVNSCRGLVQNQDAGLSQQRSSQTQQLPLPNAEKRVTCVDTSVECFLGAEGVEKKYPALNSTCFKYSE